MARCCDTFINAKTNPALWSQPLLTNKFSNTQSTTSASLTKKCASKKKAQERKQSMKSHGRSNTMSRLQHDPKPKNPKVDSQPVRQTPIQQITQEWIQEVQQHPLKNLITFAIYGTIFFTAGWIIMHVINTNTTCHYETTNEYQNTQGLLNNQHQQYYINWQRENGSLPVKSINCGIGIAQAYGQTHWRITTARGNTRKEK